MSDDIGRLTDRIVGTWDEVSRAIDAILTAQPHQMTSAAAKLARSQNAMRSVLHEEATGRPSRFAEALSNRGEE